jgi:hypothetical protein
MERAAAGRSSTIFAERFASFRQANRRFLDACDVPGSDDDETDALCDAAADAYRDFIATPAPDHAGISLKISTLVEWHDGTLAPLDVVNSIGADARALLAGAARA